jgi:hypothetical protein
MHSSVMVDELPDIIITQDLQFTIGLILGIPDPTRLNKHNLIFVTALKILCAIPAHHYFLNPTKTTILKS